jgi:hypothetical protein
MKSFDSRTYSINDFVEWDRRTQLEISPKFQRRNVWSDSARSYLMDSIIRGKPIPKVFLKQKINPTTQTAVREVVDGQQRLRTILSYIKDGFQISKQHNSEYGGLFFSQLNEQTQTNILNYEIAVDLLTNLPDSEILDIFSRLNSYAIVLNQQEKINADHFSAFKNLADDISHEYYDFWTSNKILTDNQIVRMADVTLVADILISILEGIKTKKQIKYFYDLYEKRFDADIEKLKTQFIETLKVISDVFSNTLKNSEFRRIHIFYSLFISIYHLQFGLKDTDLPRKKLVAKDYPRVRNILENIETIFSIDDKRKLEKDENQFLEDSRRATTDTKVRVRRTEFIVKRILEN